MAPDLPESVGPTRDLERIAVVPGADLVQLDAENRKDVASQFERAVVSVTISMEKASLINFQMPQITAWAKSSGIRRFKNIAQFHRLKAGGIWAQKHTLLAVWVWSKEPGSKVAYWKGKEKPNDQNEVYTWDCGKGEVLILQDDMAFKLEAGKIEFVLLMSMESSVSPEVVIPSCH